VLDGARTRAGDHLGVGRPEHQPARHGQEPRAGTLLEPPPELVRALDDRDVQRLLEVGLADDPSAAVRRAERVRRPVAVEAEHALPARGELERGLAAHRTEPDHSDVVASHEAHIPPAAPEQTLTPSDATTSFRHFMARARGKHSLISLPVVFTRSRLG
jgi:hypothetical protein